jgi:urocanate hydratase
LVWSAIALTSVPEMVKRNFVPDLLTDQTSAHDALNGYVPNQMSLAEAIAVRTKNPDEYVKRAMQAMAEHVSAMLELQKRGAITFDYGNNIRTQAKKPVSRTPTIFPASFRSISARFFARGKVHFAGLL